MIVVDAAVVVSRDTAGEKALAKAEKIDKDKVDPDSVEQMKEAARTASQRPADRRRRGSGDGPYRSDANRSVARISSWVRPGSSPA